MNLKEKFIKLQCFRYRWRRSFASRTEILWEGEHYVLFRSGPTPDKGRFTALVDRVGLLHSEKTSPLEQLATGFHPVQLDRTRSPEILHSRDGGVFTGRWSKKLHAKILEYARVRDASYMTDLPKWISNYEEQCRKEAEFERAERRAVARLVSQSRKETQDIPGASVKLGGVSSHVEYEKLGYVQFFYDANSEIIDTTTRLNLSEEEFLRLLKFVSDLKRGRDS